MFTKESLLTDMWHLKKIIVLNDSLRKESLLTDMLCLKKIIVLNDSLQKESLLESCNYNKRKS